MYSLFIEYIALSAHKFNIGRNALNENSNREEMWKFTRDIFDAFSLEQIDKSYEKMKRIFWIKIIYNLRSCELFC